MKLVWIRNDIRLRDNPALYQACEAAREDGESVRALYTITPSQWQVHDEAPIKIGFRADALTELAASLAGKGIEFDTLKADDYSQLPAALLDYCREHQVSSVWFNEENWINEQQRDERVEQALCSVGVRCRVFANELIIDADSLLTQQQQPYKVFTAWYRLWVRRLQQTDIRPLPEPSAIGASCAASSISLPDSQPYRHDLWPASEQIAHQRLDDFISHQINDYEKHRDFPAIRGTSVLSPYFASGILSARDVLYQAMEACRSEGLHWENSVWIKELAWREFYRYLMIQFPHLGKHQPFRPETNGLIWEQNSEQATAWEQGQTGYPIIDAAMRQLNQTGWMHNRLRMLVASFYTKLLLLDWRQGEQYFMRHLLDGDFASNNGGWQWSASTGCDASPWFRIFNPLKQSEKFDSEGVFIRKLVPELAELSDKAIHCPDAKTRESLGYPQPIIDYSQARQRALHRFGQLSEKRSA